jgi:hypothetical protein
LELVASDNRERVIDSHTHATGIDLVNVGRRRIPTSQSALDLAYRCATTGVDLAVCYLISVPFHHDLNQWPAGIVRGTGPESFPFEIINKQHVFERTTNGAGCLLPLAGVDPTAGAAAQLRSVEQLVGVIFGLKYHTTIAGETVAILGRTGFASLAVAADLPVTVHSWFAPEHSSPRYVLDLAERYPYLRINVAHAAGLDVEVVRRIHELPNVFLDCAPRQLNLHDHRARSRRGGDDWPDDPLSALIMLYELAPSSLMWGTDVPWTSRIDRRVRLDFSHESEVRLLRELLRYVRRAISWDNTLRWLFGSASLAVATSRLRDKAARLMTSDVLA